MPQHDTVARKSLNLLEFLQLRWWLWWDNSQVYHIHNHLCKLLKISLISENGSSNTYISVSLFEVKGWCVGFFFILIETIFWFCLFKASVNNQYFVIGIQGLLKQSSVQKIYNGLQGYWQPGRAAHWHSCKRVYLLFSDFSQDGLVSFCFYLIWRFLFDINTKNTMSLFN